MNTNLFFVFACAFGVLRYHCLVKAHEELLLCFRLSFTVLALPLRCVTHLELIFTCGASFACGCSAPFAERSFFAPLDALDTLREPADRGFPFLFRRSVCLSFGQHRTVLIAVALW